MLMASNFTHTCSIPEFNWVPELYASVVPAVWAFAWNWDIHPLIEKKFLGQNFKCFRAIVIDGLFRICIP